MKDRAEFVEIFKVGAMPVLVNFDKGVIAHDFGLVDYYTIHEQLVWKVREDVYDIRTLLNNINNDVLEYLIDQNLEYMLEKYPALTNKLIEKK